MSPRGAAAPGLWFASLLPTGGSSSDLGKAVPKPPSAAAELQNPRPALSVCCAREPSGVTHVSQCISGLLVLPVTSLLSLSPAVTWDAMASSSDSDDDGFMAVDAEDAVVEGTMEQEDEPHAELEVEEPRPSSRSMLELPEEVLEYILSFLSPYQEHKTAALVCKQWYRLIKGTSGGSAFL